MFHLILFALFYSGTSAAIEIAPHEMLEKLATECLQGQQASCVKFREDYDGMIPAPQLVKNNSVYEALCETGLSAKTCGYLAFNLRELPAKKEQRHHLYLKGCEGGDEGACNSLALIKDKLDEPFKSDSLSAMKSRCAAEGEPICEDALAFRENQGEKKEVLKEVTELCNKGITKMCRWGYWSVLESDRKQAEKFLRTACLNDDQRACTMADEEFRKPASEQTAAQ